MSVFKVYFKRKNKIIDNRSFEVHFLFMNYIPNKSLTLNEQKCIIGSRRNLRGIYMNVSYIRVSSLEQNFDMQKELLDKYEIDKCFEEKISAKDANRPQLQAMIDYVREGDTVYVRDFSRLARSTKDLLDIVERLNSKGVKLVSVKESLDTSTAQGKLMLTMLGAVYEFERTNLLERQREGIAIAKEQGKYQGRKKIEFPANWEEVYRKWHDKKISAAVAMKELSLKKTTFYKLTKEYEEQNKS